MIFKLRSCHHQSATDQRPLVTIVFDRQCSNDHLSPLNIPHFRRVKHAKMATLAALYNCLGENFVGLNESVTVQDIEYFIRLVAYFKNEIRLHTPHNNEAPLYRLPAYIFSLKGV